MWYQNVFSGNVFKLNCSCKDIVTDFTTSNNLGRFYMGRFALFTALTTKHCLTLANVCAAPT
jgi:hypothetical protein